MRKGCSLSQWEPPTLHQYGPHDKWRSGDHAHRKIIRLWENNDLSEKVCENSRNVYNLAETNNIIIYTYATFAVNFNLSFSNPTQNNKMWGVRTKFHDRHFFLILLDIGIVLLSFEDTYTELFHVLANRFKKYTYSPTNFLQVLNTSVFHLHRQKNTFPLCEHVSDRIINVPLLFSQ